MRVTEPQRKSRRVCVCVCVWWRGAWRANEFTSGHAEFELRREAEVGQTPTGRTDGRARRGRCTQSGKLRISSPQGRRVSEGVQSRSQVFSLSDEHPPR